MGGEGGGGVTFKGGFQCRSGVILSLERMGMFSWGGTVSGGVGGKDAKMGVGDWGG